MTDNEGKSGELSWYTRCIVCRHKVRCRDEHVERGSKKCRNLLRLDDKRNPR